MPQADQHRHPNFCARGRQDHPHLDDAERAQFHQYAGMEHADPGGGGDVAVRRPGMEGPQAGQDAEPHGEQREHPQLQGTGKRAVVSQLRQRVDVERGAAGLGRRHVQREYPNPDEHAAGHQHQHQLHRAVLFRAQEGAEIGAAPPNPDEQIHRQHSQFVEKEQEKEVANDENAKHARAQGQQQDEEIPRPPGDGLADQRRPQQHNAVEQHQRGANPVQPQVQRYVERVPYPGVFAGELDATDRVVVPEEDDHGQHERDGCYEDGKLPGIPGPVLGQEHRQHGPGQRHEDEQ